MSVRVVTVFGGTGFLGRRVVDHLRKQDFIVRVASRHASRSRELFGPDGPQFQSVEADIHDTHAVADALAGAYAAVNSVSLYVERRGETFHSVHVEAARRLAARAQQIGLERLVQVSGIGADPASPSLYIRKRGEGELAVRAAFPDAVIVRPAVMFGPDDAFLNTVLALLRMLPVFPMFGRGLTRLQPAYVGDVGQAIARVLERTERRAITFECGGPRIYSYEELLRAVAREAGLTARLMPMPFAAWHAMASVGQMLPNAPVTRNQIELMQVDNVASPSMPGFAELGISPRPLQDVLREMLAEQPRGR
jgi:NADH dehydrogenase